MTNLFRQGIFINLSDLPMPDGSENWTPKPFDGMSAGVFTDMWGSTFEFKADDLPLYVSNTRAALASTRDTSGNVVGFPIDGIDHRGGFAAGWIVDVALAAGREVVQFTPRWTAEGQANISNDLVRYFSPTIDIEHKTIVGGSLTNWPATRDESNNILLRPIELGSSILTVHDEQPTLVERVKEIVKNFFGMPELAAVPYKDTGKAAIGTSWSGPSLSDLSDTSFPSMDDAEKRRVMGHFAWTANNPPESFSDLKLPHHQASKTSIGPAVWRGIAAAMAALMGARGGPDIPSGDKQSVYNHLSRHYVQFEKEPPKFEMLGEMDGSTYLSLLTGETIMAEPTKDTQNVVDLSTPEGSAELNRRVEEQVAARLAKQKQEEDIKTFVAQLVAGDGKKALAIDGDKTTAFLTAQPDPTAAMELLKEFNTAALLSFDEKGHGKVMTGSQPLPDALKPILLSWLASGKTKAEFFQVNAVELGNMEDYDLSEFIEKESK